MAALTGPIPTLVPAAPAPDFDRNLHHLILTLTDQCNLRCAYCLHGGQLGWVRPHGSRVMSEEVALRAVGYFLERCMRDQPPAISFYGGEPLLQPELIRRVAQVVRRHPRGGEAHLVVDTNGYGLDPEMIELVVEYGLSLQISLDGPREVHDRHRLTAGGRPTFFRIMANLHRLLLRDPACHERLAFVCTLAPPVEAEAVERFFNHFPLFHQHGIEAEPRLRVNLASLRGLDWPATEQERRALRDWVAGKREKYYRTVAAGQRQVLGPFIKALVEPGLLRLHHRSAAEMGASYTPGANCRPGVRKLHVTAEGRFQPCERVGAHMAIGDVETGIDREAVARLNREFFAGVSRRCAGCWALRLCRVCYASWAEQGAADGSFPETACARVRSAVMEDLKLSVRLLELEAGKREFLDRVVLL